MSKKIILFSLLAIIVVGGSVTIFNLYNRSGQEKNTEISAILAKVTPEELIKGSDGVIIGTVKDLSVTKAPSNLRAGEQDIVTNVNIAVEKYLSNPKNLSLENITVQVVGGTIGKETMTAEDSPDFEVGQKVLVFLKQGSNGILTVYGWSQGKYTVVNDQISGSEKERDVFKSIFGRELTITELEKQIDSSSSSSKNIK